MKLALSLVLGWLLLGEAARADHDSLVPTYAEAQARVAHRAESKLEQTLRKLPDVSDARVHITPADLSHLPLDAPAPAPRVSAWLALHGPGPDDASLRALLSAGVLGGPPESIEIVRQRIAPEVSAPVRFAVVGPFRVASESAPWLRAALALLLITNVILATVVVIRGRRSI